MAAQFIREIDYSTWLSNVVMVKKPNGKWRTYMNYMDQNQTCPKNAYPFLNIDNLINGVARHKLSFLDAHSD